MCLFFKNYIFYKFSEGENAPLVLFLRTPIVLGEGGFVMYIAIFMKKLILQVVFTILRILENHFKFQFLLLLYIQTKERKDVTHAQRALYDLLNKSKQSYKQGQLKSYILSNKGPYRV